MELPKASATSTSTNMISVWGGYNRGLRVADGEFYDMQNLTSDYYPVFSPRAKRGLVATLEKCNGFAATDKLMWVDNDAFYFDSQYVCMLSGDTEKQFVQMGAYVCIFPDKIAYNTHDGTLLRMEKSWTTLENPTFTLCKNDGSQYDTEHMYTGDIEPEDRTTYYWWMDTSSVPVVLKRYSETAAQWVAVATTYVKIESPGIGANFNEDDAVSISGCDNADFNTSMIIQSKDTDWICVIGIIDRVFTNSGAVTIKREVPDMDFVCELNNRLWGCSSEKHEIYACKQGDPCNWNYFGGLTSDSYAATVGTEGKFTGAVAHLGYVLFFKDSGVHKVYGYSPATYEISWTELRGVQEGSEKSLVVLNEYLYYKSRNGICVYDGSLPVDISTCFGTEKYFDAVAGGINDKYYVSMRDRDYNWYLFVYDTRNQLWHKEDGVMAHGFAYYDGGSYMVDQFNHMWVWPIEQMYTYLFPDMTWDDLYAYPSEEIFPNYATKGTSEDDIEWMAESGDIGLDSPYNKYISRIVLRAMISEGSSIKIEVMYDSSGTWEELLTYVADGKRSYTIPVQVRRCDHMKLRLSGVGDVKIYSLAKTLENGSEV